MHLHEVVVGVEVFADLAHVGDEFLSGCIFALEGEVGVVGQVVADLVAGVAEVLEADVLRLLQVGLVVVDLRADLLHVLVELDDLAQHGVYCLL